MVGRRNEKSFAGEIDSVGQECLAVDNGIVSAYVGVANYVGFAKNRNPAHGLRRTHPLPRAVLTVSKDLV